MDEGRGDTFHASPEACAVHATMVSWLVSCGYLCDRYFAPSLAAEELTHFRWRFSFKQQVSRARLVHGTPLFLSFARPSANACCCTCFHPQ